jgi:UPF0716 family protein affecting phage T7 exclusion
MRTLKHTFRLVSGIFLCVLGVIGLILPVMPGWIFLIPGLLILGDYFPPIRRLVEWAKGRFREARAQFDESRPPEQGTNPSSSSESHAKVSGVAANRQET